MAPRYFASGRYRAYFAASVGSVVLLAGVRLVENLAVVAVWDVAPSGYFSTASLLDSLSDMATNLLCFTGVSLTVLLKYWTGAQENISRLETRAIAAKVEAMKDSVDPGTLLSTIHECGRRAHNDPSLSCEMILKLSELLRYQLYESGEPEVFLSSEIAFTRNYLELEKLRDPSLEYEIRSGGKQMVKYVPSMIFLPFVKLAVANRAGGGRISLDFDADENSLTFTCSGLGGNIQGQAREAAHRLGAALGARMHFDIRDCNLHLTLHDGKR
ncbi:MAG: histidine kinase [Alistipes sp.]|nr:histidine kinase [Alistipes sp.]